MTITNFLKPATAAGFLLPSERRMLNRQRLLLRTGLDVRAAREAVEWVRASRFDWIARRRANLMMSVL